MAKKPAAQDEQLVAPVLTVENPAAQTRQPPISDVGAKEPAGQDTQAAAEEFTKEPEGQEPYQVKNCKRRI